MRKALIPGTTTLLVGTAGSGKTAACLQFLKGTSPDDIDDGDVQKKDAGQAIVSALPLKRRLYVNFENPKSQLHRLSNRNSAFDELFQNAEMIYRRRGNLDINVLLSEIEFVIRVKNINRVVIDGLSDLLTTTKEDDYARLVEALLSTIREASGKNRASTFITFELDDEQTHQGLIAIEGLSAAADNVVVLRQMPIGDELRKAAYVLKARGMSHDPHVREVHIDNNKQFPLRIVAGLESFSGLLRGEPHPVEIVLQLFAENSAEQRFNEQLLQRLRGLFQHKVEAFGFSRSSLNRTLDDIASPTGRIPPSDIKVVSLDEWWIREFDARAKKERQEKEGPEASTNPGGEGQESAIPPEHPLLPLELFFGTPSASDPKRHRHLTSQAQFWLLEIEKATIHEPPVQPQAKQKSETSQAVSTPPQTPQTGVSIAIGGGVPGAHAGETPSVDESKPGIVNAPLLQGEASPSAPDTLLPEVRLYGVPNYTDFGLFCLNPNVAKEAHLSRLLGPWPDVLDYVPRAWIRHADASTQKDFGFKEPDRRFPSVLVDWFAKAQQADPALWGFCFDSETVESTSCMFLELCWAFGADENFLSQGNSGRSCAKDALSLLQYLVYHGLMPSRPKLEDSRKSLFSRQWYSTLVEHSELLALPFFAVGAAPVDVEERGDLLWSALVDASARIHRLAERVHFALLYRGADDAAVEEARFCSEQARRLESIAGVQRSCDVHQWFSACQCTETLRTLGRCIRDLAMKAPQLARGYPVKKVDSIPAVERFDLNEGLTAALVMNVRDVLELLRWHDLRLSLIEAELKGKTLTEAIDPKASSAPTSDPLQIRALTGYCCSGSWMVGVGRRTHSPLLSWKLIEEITSSEQAVNRSRLGAGIPARKDFFDAYGETQAVNTEHLTWNELLLYAGSRARHRHRLVDDGKPLKERFESIHAVVLHCLSMAEAARVDKVRVGTISENEKTLALSIAKCSMKAAVDAATQGVETLFGGVK